jgi:hypothetical protein
MPEPKDEPSPETTAQAEPAEAQAEPAEAQAEPAEAQAEPAEDVQSAPSAPYEKSSEEALREAAGEAANATMKVLSGIGKIIKEKSSEIKTDEIAGKLKSMGKKLTPDRTKASVTSGDEGAASDNENIGPIVPYLHGTINQQRLVTLGMVLGLILLMMINMGSWGILAGLAISSFALIGAMILLVTSKARVKFTNLTNCFNVLLGSMYIGLIVGKILGEVVAGVDPTDLGNFVKDYEQNTFGIGLFCFVLYCIGFFPSGRLIWSRNFKDVWKAGTIVTTFTAIWYIIIMPYMVLAALKSVI